MSLPPSYAHQQEEESRNSGRSGIEQHFDPRLASLTPLQQNSFPTNLVPNHYSVSGHMPTLEPPVPGFEFLMTQSYINLYFDSLCCLGEMQFHFEDSEENEVLRAETVVNFCMWDPANYVIYDLRGNKISIIDTTEKPFKVQASNGQILGYIKLITQRRSQTLDILSDDGSELFSIILFPTKEIYKRRFPVETTSGATIPSSVLETHREWRTFNLNTTMPSNTAYKTKLLILHSFLILNYCAQRIT